jgi:hypothetical protein
VPLKDGKRLFDFIQIRNFVSLIEYYSLDKNGQAEKIKEEIEKRFSENPYDLGRKVVRSFYYIFDPEYFDKNPYFKSQIPDTKEGCINFVSEALKMADEICAKLSIPPISVCHNGFDMDETMDYDKMKTEIKRVYNEMIKQKDGKT